MVLSKEAMKILCKINNGTYVSVKDDNKTLRYLYNEELVFMPRIVDGLNYSEPSITEKGKGLLHEAKTVQHKEILANVRYIITTLIALAAFIKSFFF